MFRCFKAMPTQVNGRKTAATSNVLQKCWNCPQQMWLTIFEAYVSAGNCKNSQFGFFVGCQLVRCCNENAAAILIDCS